MSSSSKQNNESLLMDYMNNEYDIITINPNIDYESDRSSNASPSRSRSSSVGSVIFENEDMDLEPPMTGLGGYSSDSSSSSSSSSDSSSSSESDDEEISQIEDVSKMAKPEIKISMDVKMKSALPARIECNTQIVQEIVKTKEIEQNNNIILQPKIKILPIELIKKEDVLTKLLSGNVNKSSNKVYSSPGELTVDLTCDNLTGVKSPAPEKKTKKLNLQEYKKRRVGTQIPRDDTESNTKRCQLQLDLANMPTSLPDILLPNLDGSINPLMIKKKEPVPLSPCHNPDYEEVTTISIGCNTEVTIKPDTVEAEDEDTSPSFKNIVNILKQDNKHGLLKSQNSLLSSIHNVVIQ